jgi:glycosyltransferase involved in cell wall biosynthesis
MRILLLHNRYQQSGGEDVVVKGEMGLFRQRGHDVYLLEVDNHEIDGVLSRVRTAARAIYSAESRTRVALVISDFQPDVVHVHNFFPLLSPSVYYACQSAGVPVVQTLHNYRLLCPNGLFFRDGRPCEDCLGKRIAWPGAAHGCYRSSRAASSAVGAMLAVHRLMGTWKEAVDAYIALTEFSRKKFIEGGLPATKIYVKPNCVSEGRLGDGRGGYALFVGRLSLEKGLEILLATWKRHRPRLPLWIVGDGPLSPCVSAAVSADVIYLGQRGREEVQDLMRDAAMLIVPSTCYENFAMVVAEAFASGLPVIASAVGSFGSLIDHGRTGLLFRVGDPDDLAAQIEWLLTNPEVLSRMRRAAWAEYKAKYTPERNYEMLMEIYRRVVCPQGQPDDVEVDVSA